MNSTVHSEWQEYFASTPRLTEDGPCSGWLMRRYQPGKMEYEYRRMTDKEEADYVSREAW